MRNLMSNLQQSRRLFKDRLLPRRRWADPTGPQELVLCGYRSWVSLVSGSLHSLVSFLEWPR